MNPLHVLTERAEPLKRELTADEARVFPLSADGLPVCVCPSGGASDGEADGREAAGRTQVSELQGQHPQPAPVAA